MFLTKKRKEIIESEFSLLHSRIADLEQKLHTVLSHQGLQIRQNWQVEKYIVEKKVSDGLTGTVGGIALTKGRMKL